MKFVAFDLELKEEIPEGCTDWRSVGPLGITCAATYRSDGTSSLWNPRFADSGLQYRERMTADQVDEMAYYLLDQVRAGYLLITWNGLGFDLPVMVEEMRDERLKFEIAHCALYGHIDMAYQMRCEKGFMIGLNTCAQAVGIEGKTEGMHGDLAPVMWKKGLDEQKRVLEYVAQDAKATADVYAAILDQRSFKWITKKGRLSYKPWAPWIRYGEDHLRMLTCAEAARLPKADTSWMDRKPSTVESYYAWTGISLGDVNDPGAVTTAEAKGMGIFGGTGYRTPESEGVGPEYPVENELPPGFVEDTDIPF